MKQNAINAIQSKTFFDYTSNQASDSEVITLVEESKVVLDQDYQHFLKSINGFSLNGLNFYGTREQPEIYVLDALKQNKFWAGEIPELEEYFIIADGDMDFYCYNSLERKYYALTKATLTKVEIHDNFQAMLESILKIY
jgi:hypothetical protein